MPRTRDVLFFSAIVLLGPAGSSAIITDPASYVNVFIGTTNGGHVFPGATLPHGMVKVGMDTDSPGNQAGYDADSAFKATGFSQLHDTGTGGGASLSNFKLWPLSRCSSFESCTTSMHDRKALRKTRSDGFPDDLGSPGYFATNLSTGVRVELTASRRTALHRYTFPASSRIPRILVDITNDGMESAFNPVVDIDSRTGRVTGGARFSASFGHGSYDLYTCVDFKGDGYSIPSVSEYGIYTGNEPVRGRANFTHGTASVLYQEDSYTHHVNPGYASEIGALIGFPPSSNTTHQSTTILARVGVSFISSAQACKSAESEIPHFDFNATRQKSREVWNDLLGRVQVDTHGVDRETIDLFYSSLYRTHIVPADYTGENPRWNSTEPYYDSFYCNWDTYRTLFPLMSLHDPAEFARIDGFLSVAELLCNNMYKEAAVSGALGLYHVTCLSYSQRPRGEGGDPILAEFFVKFHEHAAALNVSADALYTALLADAEVQPDDWNLQGRQVDTWKKYNYIPSDIHSRGGMNTRQVSRTLEYAFNDFSIAQVSKILDKTDDFIKYSRRATNFFNVWNPNVTLPGHPEIKGMMQPRFASGRWNYTDPRHCSPKDPTHSACFLDGFNTDGFYEGSPMAYSQYVPQDTARLIQMQGGKEAFIKRLDLVIDEGYFDVTDEPSQQIPFMYHYANRPGLSTQRSRETISRFYNTTVHGLPGNDDSGAMGSYAVFYLAGMYPLPATRQFLLSSPYFPKISFFNPILNTTTTFKVKGFKGNPKDGKGGKVFVKVCLNRWIIDLVGILAHLYLPEREDRRKAMEVELLCGMGRLPTGLHD
ncbi:glycoside hydrolase family 92 protein [Leucogyrophana mollusca]|uniref:Glycoside hydrolase family 92 protein n=1 Tax=Leucogyrophana mollusca TaxID=85980 RepID=A0ACB8B9G1_9AGAM|nr:glycoside hydrolase family 92 protein [Leucogyrophana mollusca]